VPTEWVNTPGVWDWLTHNAAQHLLKDALDSVLWRLNCILDGADRTRTRDQRVIDRSTQTVPVFVVPQGD
jgi:hypothetical protein